jgi:hypothetical protein
MKKQVASTRKLKSSSKPRPADREKRLEDNLLRDPSTEQLLSKIKANEDPVDKMYVNEYFLKSTGSKAVLRTQSGQSQSSAKKQVYMLTGQVNIQNNDTKPARHSSAKNFLPTSPFSPEPEDNIPTEDEGRIITQLQTGNQSPSLAGQTNIQRLQTEYQSKPVGINIEANRGSLRSREAFQS